VGQLDPAAPTPLPLTVYNTREVGQRELDLDGEYVFYVRNEHMSMLPGNPPRANEMDIATS
jgi:hypothetical protein